MRAMNTLTRIKIEILSALAHPEAEDGLYFENLVNLHEDEERTAVVGSQPEVLEALKELVNERKIVMNESGEKVIFSLSDPSE